MTSKIAKDFELRKIQKAIKTLMKKNRVTYDILASDLRISPATIKRRLNGKSISIAHLSQISKILGVTFYELIELSKAEGSQAYEFCEDQEAVLAADFNHILVFRMILMGLEFKGIYTRLCISEAMLRAILKKLEAVNLVQLMAKDRIVPMAKFPFKWIPKGLLDRTYGKHIVNELFKRSAQDNGTAGINKKFEIVLTPDLYKNFCLEIDRIYQKYQGFSQAVLDSGANENLLTSGILFIDQFSCWGERPC